MTTILFTIIFFFTADIPALTGFEESAEALPFNFIKKCHPLIYLVTKIYAGSMTL